MSPQTTARPTPPYSALDQAFARYLQQVQPSPHPHHTELVLRTSQQFGQGHACLELSALPDELRHSAASLPWIAEPNSPLVLDGTRLYLRRNWSAEQRIRASIAARLAQPCPVPQHLRASLAQLFVPAALAPNGTTATAPASAAPDWQQVACALAARQHITLITGGPGTGKTTTVVRLLALLLADPARQQYTSTSTSNGNANDTATAAVVTTTTTTTTPLRIALAAPTGKAAARLSESIASAVQQLPGHLRPHIPRQAVTLHKLLQVRDNMANDPVPELAVDLVVVDEASMIDLDMMARLLAAVPLGARLVLLGDKDQLASVEAGAVMGQLCAGADRGGYSADTVAWVAQHTGADISAWAGEGTALAQQTVMLRFSRRFDHDSPIGQWATAVNAGQMATLQALWPRTPTWQAQAQAQAQVHAHAPAAVTTTTRAAVNKLQPTHPGDPALGARVRHGWQHWLRQMQALTTAGCTDAHALAALSAFGQFQVLCALREGPWGVEALNRRIATSLGFAPEGWYAGRPVMVTRNDYTLQRMNGDVGLCLPHPNGLRVAFPDGRGGIHWVLPSRLDAVDSVFAMTVHKSQGSEFEQVCLVLPDQPSAVLTRELLYTGITRAKSQLTLVVPQTPVLLQAAKTRVVRSGGLA